MKTLTQTILILLLLAGGLVGFGQNRKGKNKLPLEEIIRLRTELYNEIENQNYEHAKHIKEILINNQDTEGEYLSYREYCILLMLTGEFDELLNSQDSIRELTTLDYRFESIEDELKTSLKENKNEVLLLINQYPKPEERPGLRNTLQKLIYDKSLPREFWLNTSSTSAYTPSWDGFGKYKDKDERYFDKFFYLFNDSMIDCASVKYNKRFLAKNTFSCDNNTFYANQVKFYGDGEYFYANVKKEGKSPKFYKRYGSGKINYYKKDYIAHHYGYTSPGYYNPATGSWTPGYSTPSYDEHVLIQYYNFGYEDIKRATYKNLVEDISHNSSSKYYLDRYRKKNRTENTLAIIGGSLTIGGLALIAVSPEAGAIAATCGFLLLCVDLWIIFPNNDKEVELGNAIKAYNREY